MTIHFGKITRLINVMGYGEMPGLPVGMGAYSFESRGVDGADHPIVRISPTAYLPPYAKALLTPQGDFHSLEILDPTWTPHQAVLQQELQTIGQLFRVQA